MSAILLSLCSFIIVAYLIPTVWMTVVQWRDPVRRRLLAFSPSANQPKVLAARRWLESALAKTLALLGAGPEIHSSIQTFSKKIMLAALLAATAAGMLEAILRTARVTHWPAPLTILLSLGSVWVGMGMTVKLWTRWQVRFRQEKIKEGLTLALDLWSLCLGAGMSFQGALVRVIQEPDLIHPTLHKELLLTNDEILAGCPREDALKNLARRCGDISELRVLVSHVIQSERLGTSLAQTLQSYADSLRFKQRQDIKEAIQKLPVKLTFPLIFFILPALFVVLLGPAALQLFSLFSW
ncbi:MAG: type II secretion system F family protein [Candidatus Omnitrophica bacterium]|nr:type II secretion system F family protein [Candidatus Omnitrophota bacterium]